MTIKVCKEKFETRALKLLIIITNFVSITSLCTFVYIILAVTNVIDDITTKDTIGFVVMYTIIGGLFANVFLFVFECHWISLIIRHQKLFEWNRDC